jgi:multimeric flavodoxin WrbA
MIKGENMKVLGIYGSPRKDGNSDIVLDRILQGAEAAGAEVDRVYARELKMEGCRECGGCDKTGKCVVKDDMQPVYPKLLGSDMIFLSSPNFFYSVSAQVKMLIDRCQAIWSKRMLEKTAEERKRYDSGTGYLAMVGATRGERRFEGGELVAYYFYDALDMTYAGGVFFDAEGKGDISDKPEDLERAFEFGKKAVESFTG